MQVITVNDYEELSVKANEIMKEVLLNNANPILGLATGSSPIGMYKKMIEDYKNKVTNFENVRTVNLDEYMGLDASSDQSYVYFMNTNLFDHININKANTNLPNGKAEDIFAEGERYNKRLSELKQDLQILGIGSNGHIGFNEPGTSFDSKTHVVELAQKTREDNARFFKSIDEVPTHAITMGIQNIMDAKKILVVACGASKQDAVYAMVKGEITENCPATILQKHDDVILIVDKEASGKL